MDESLRLAFRTRFYKTVEAWPVDLETWLHENNYEWSHQGYCNLGKRPSIRTKEYRAG